MKGPIGWRMPPITATTRMPMTSPTPTVPGEMRPLNQTYQHAAGAGDDPGEEIGGDAVSVTSKPSARMRRGLSRIAISARPKVERAQ